MYVQGGGSDWDAEVDFTEAECSMAVMEVAEVGEDVVWCVEVKVEVVGAVKQAGAYDVELLPLAESTAIR